MLEISPNAFAALSDGVRRENFPLLHARLSAALAGEPGRALNVQHYARDKEHVSKLVVQAELVGLDGEKDIIAFGLLHAGPEIELPIATRDWIREILTNCEEAWANRLDAIHALLPGPTRSLVFASS